MVSSFYVILGYYIVTSTGNPAHSEDPQAQCPGLPSLKCISPAAIMTQGLKTLFHTHLTVLRHYQILRLPFDPELKLGMSLKTHRHDTLVLDMYLGDNSVVRNQMADTLTQVQGCEQYPLHIREVNIPSIVPLHPLSHKTSEEDRGKDIKVFRALLISVLVQLHSIVEPGAGMVNTPTFYFFQPD